MKAHDPLNRFGWSDADWAANNAFKAKIIVSVDLIAPSCLNFSLDHILIANTFGTATTIVHGVSKAKAIVADKCGVSNSVRQIA